MGVAIWFRCQASYQKFCKSIQKSQIYLFTLFINYIEMSLKEDLIYFFSIVGAFLFLNLTHQGCLQHLLSLSTDSLSFYGFLFADFLIICQFCSWLKLKLRRPKKGQKIVKEPVNNTGLKYEEHLILGLIITVFLLQAHYNHSSICSTQRMSTILTWFIFSRVFSSVGALLNQRSGIKVWNVFGDSMSIWVCAVTIGFTLGVDTFKFL